MAASHNEVTARRGPSSGSNVHDDEGMLDAHMSQPALASPPPATPAAGGGAEPRLAAEAREAARESAATREAPPPQGGNLARVLQLQERLARERSSLARAATPGHAVPPMAGGAGAPASKRQPSTSVAAADADPFENFERGELRVPQQSPVRHNPAIVTNDGEPFVFRHDFS